MMTTVIPLREYTHTTCVVGGFAIEAMCQCSKHENIVVGHEATLTVMFFQGGLRQGSIRADRCPS
jgi:hypothetical protein